MVMFWFKNEMDEMICEGFIMSCEEGSFPPENDQTDTAIGYFYMTGTD
jgi:hypothetical protein